MKRFITLSVVLFSLQFLQTNNAFAVGGISAGGGGDTDTSPRSSPQEIQSHLSSARQELYMELSLESWNPLFPWPELFTGTPNILDWIKKDKVYSGDSCEDLYGTSKDGSMYSSVPNTICINANNLGKKLTSPESRAQTLALVAHEYSHLKGFDEEHAQALQKYLLKVFTDSSSLQSKNLLNDLADNLWQLRDSIVEFQNKSQTELTWDYLCYLSNQIHTSLKAIEGGALNSPYSALDKDLYRKQNSYYVLQTALTTQACAQSSFDPNKDFYKQTVKNWFAIQNSISILQIAHDVFTDFNPQACTELDKYLIVEKISTPSDFARQIVLFRNYILEDLTPRMLLLWQLGNYSQKEMPR